MELTDSGTATAESTVVSTENGGSDAPPDSEGPSNRNIRQGTISSARFNILCTMVGGGCLSLPMAFQKTGNGLFGPALLILTAAVTDAVFRMIIASTCKLSPVHADTVVVGKTSYESLASAAFGARGYLYTKWIVTAICIFGAVAYAVLLRDLLAPIADAISGNHDNHPSSGPSLAGNLTMLTVILLITPVCALQNLSSLDKLGAASMSAILIVGACIAFRSLQCLTGHHHESDEYHWPSFKLWPDSAKDVLDAFPLFVSCYVCHYNLPLVHNELANATPERVHWWLRSTTLSASLFYFTVGLTGSAYGHCTPTGKVQGNILLDFDEDDPLLVVARMCLACTVTLAFPLLVIPARDIILRSWFETTTNNSSDEEEPTTEMPPTTTTTTSVEDSLQEPLLPNGEGEEEAPQTTQTETEPATAEPEQQQTQQYSLPLRLGVGILVLWSAAGVASCVKSIDIVWDLLGSSLSVILSYLIPGFSYLAVFGDDSNSEENSRARAFAQGLIYVFVPLMVISSINAFYDTFFA